MRAIFLDRDGVICENRSDYVKSWAEFEFLPQAKASIAALSRLDLPIIVVTNQSVIGRGLVSEKTLNDIHHRMLAEITAYGGRIDRILYCPHRPEDKCDCRKPEVGMFRQAAQKMNIDLQASYMVGDAATDVMAGQTVGCKTFLVLTGLGLTQLRPTLRIAGDNIIITRDLAKATTHILKAELLLETQVRASPYHIK